MHNNELILKFTKSSQMNASDGYIIYRGAYVPMYIYYSCEALAQSPKMNSWFCMIKFLVKIFYSSGNYLSVFGSK